MMQIIPDDPPTLEELEKKYEQVIMIEIGGGIFENKNRVLSFRHYGSRALWRCSENEEVTGHRADENILDAEDGTPLSSSVFSNS